MHIFMEMFRMNGANERGSTIDVARDKSSRADRDCERYAIRKIQYNVSFRSFFFFFSDLSFAFKRTRIYR